MKPKAWAYGGGIWILFEVASILFGRVIQSFVSPKIGVYGGHIVHTILMVFFVLLVTRLLLNLMEVTYTYLDLVFIGITWFSLSITFEFGYYHYILGESWNTLFAEYNIFKGRIGSLVLITQLISPFLGFTSFKDREGTAVMVGLVLVLISFSLLTTPLFLPLLVGGDIFLILQVKNRPKAFGLVLLGLQLFSYFTIFSFLIYLAPLVWFLFFTHIPALIYNKRKTLWIHCPSVVEKGEAFELTVEAWDRFERLAGGYEGQISFDIKSYNLDLESIADIKANLPKDYTFTSSIPSQGLLPAYLFQGADNGKKHFDAQINTPGIHYIQVKEGENLYRSNPILVHPENTDRKNIFWGDIHGHTLYSDGAGSLQHAYEFARKVALVDFAAITDHLTKFLKIKKVLRHYFNVTKEHNEPGNFVTFPAIEWSPGFLFTGKVSGHFNIYFKDADSLTRPMKWKESEEIYEYMEKERRELLAWPHHTVKKEFLTDWGVYNEDLSPLVEIWSVHGSSEESKKGQEDPRYKGYSVRDALTMGYHVGFMASSDTHDGRLGHPISHTKANHILGYPYSLSGNKMEHGFEGGIVGVYANKLTRNAIFHALKTRSCYASSWVTRPLMYFEINGVSVGENNSRVHVTSPTTPRELKLFLCADGVSMKPNNPTIIETVEIFKNAQGWKTFTVHSPVFKKTITDTTEITGVTYTPIRKRGGLYVSKRSKREIKELLGTDSDFYYVRMTDSKGRKAWNGPIWVSVLNPEKENSQDDERSKSPTQL